MALRETKIIKGIDELPKLRVSTIQFFKPTNDMYTWDLIDTIYFDNGEFKDEHVERDIVYCIMGKDDSNNNVSRHYYFWLLRSGRLELASSVCAGNFDDESRKMIPILFEQGYYYDEILNILGM